MRCPSRGAALLGLALISAPADAQSMDPVAASSLMIIDPSVIGNATTTPKREVWTFKHLIDQMRGGEEAGPFVIGWLRQLTDEQTVNGHKVAGRSGVEDGFIRFWKTRDGVPENASDAEWAKALKLETAPLRLSAIIYRPDLMKGNLRDRKCLSDVNSAGEGRFIFQSIDETGAIRPFTIIFEYDLVADAPADVIQTAKDWLALSTFERGSESYLNALAALTSRFSDANPQLERPNNVSLNQLRTNEFFDQTVKWELREFRLLAGKLVIDTVKVTPDLSLDNTELLRRYVDKLAAEGKSEKGAIVVPAIFEGQKFLAGSAITPFNFEWRSPGGESPMLKRFSTATCNGCHAGNTGTMFIHVDLGAVAPRLSSFLLGDGKPAACGNDRRPGSGDLEARLCQMQALANASDNALDCDRPEAFSSIGETEILLSLPNPSLSSPTASFNLTDFLVERADRVH